MTTSFTATNAAKSGAAGSGGFLTSCHTHCEAQSNSAFDTFAIGTPSMRDAAASWITANQASGGTSAPQWLIDVPYTTTPPYVANPSCGVHAPLAHY